MVKRHPFASRNGSVEADHDRPDLSRPQRDFAPAPGSARGDDGGLGRDRQRLLDPCRRPRGARSNRRGTRSRRRACRRQARRRDLHERRHRSGRAGAFAGTGIVGASRTLRRFADIRRRTSGGARGRTLCGRANRGHSGRSRGPGRFGRARCDAHAPPQWRPARVRLGNGGEQRNRRNRAAARDRGPRSRGGRRVPHRCGADCRPLSLWP